MSASTKNPGPSLPAALVARIAVGDERALAALYDAYGHVAYALALAITRAPASAERVVVEAFGEAWRAASAFDGKRTSVLAWLTAAGDMPGTRAIIDHHTSHPTSPEMADATRVATGKEHELLALMAGRASAPGEAARRVGREIELAARASYVPGAAPRSAPAPSLVQRIRAVLAA